MYAGYFGLQHPPFSIAPDPRYLFLSARHREALAHLLYGLHGGGGIVLLTGDVGTGKTTVFRCFLEQVPQDVQVAYIFNPKLSVLELLRTICDEFQVPVVASQTGPATVKDHIDPLNAYLLDLHARGQRAILVIDEAQNLSADVLEQLRLLTNLETAECKLLQIVLIGQPELRSLLAQPSLEQLSQRVVARYHLQALSAGETCQYIRHRLGVAGWDGPLPMSDRVLRQIHRLARGIPRRINLLCDRAMLGAYGSQRKQITSAMVRQAAHEVFDTPQAGHHWVRRVLAPMIGAAALGMAAWLLWHTAPEAPTVSSNNSAAKALPAEETSQPEGLTALRQAALWTDENSAWRALMPMWGLSAKEDDDPCKQAQSSGLQCFRTWRMTLDGLVQLNRPAILIIDIAGQGPQRVLLVQRLDDGHLVLAKDNGRWRLTPEELGPVWNGGYATLWRTPPGTTERLVEARSPEQRRWIDTQLKSLQDKKWIQPAQNNYDDRLRSFQALAGVEPLGQAGPTTLMQLNQAVGVDEPRLTASP